MNKIQFCCLVRKMKLKVKKNGIILYHLFFKYKNYFMNHHHEISMVISKASIVAAEHIRALVFKFNFAKLLQAEVF